MSKEKQSFILTTAGSEGAKMKIVVIAAGEDIGDVQIAHEDARIGFSIGVALTGICTRRTLDAITAGIQSVYCSQLVNEQPSEIVEQPSEIVESTPIGRCPKCHKPIDHLVLVSVDRMVGIIRLATQEEKDGDLGDIDMEFDADTGLVSVSTSSDQVQSAFKCPKCEKPITEDDEEVAAILKGEEINPEALLEDDFWALFL